MRVESPFTIIRACRCSFEVEIDGKTAFISNHNLLAMIEHRCSDYKIREIVDPHGIHRNWVWIKEGDWTSGIDLRNFNYRRR